MSFLLSAVWLVSVPIVEAPGSARIFSPVGVWVVTLWMSSLWPASSADERAVAGSSETGPVRSPWDIIWVDKNVVCVKTRISDAGLLAISEIFWSHEEEVAADC